MEPFDFFEQSHSNIKSFSYPDNNIQVIGPLKIEFSSYKLKNFFALAWHRQTCRFNFLLQSRRKCLSIEEVFYFLQVVKTASPQFLVIILLGCILQYCEVSWNL